jgi:hypothetical protein
MTKFLLLHTELTANTKPKWQLEETKSQLGYQNFRYFEHCGGYVKKKIVEG